MASSRALDALGRLLAPAPAQVIVADADWPTLKAVYEARRRRPLFDEVAAAPASRRPRGAPAPGRDLHALLDAARVVDRPGVLLAHVREQVAQVLGLAPAQVDLKQGLFDMGMDSLMSVDLKSRLEASIGQPLPTTLTFNYPSVSAIAEYLTTQLLRTGASGPETAPTAIVRSPTTPPPTADDDDMSEDELASLLATKLAGMGGR
jgi:myxalamid-type polyketide synthase MxaE and MxaD